MKRKKMKRKVKSTIDDLDIEEDTWWMSNGHEGRAWTLG